MMIKPSIDELLKQTDGNKYVLCTLIAKRAREIESINLLDSSSEEKKAISIACDEIANGKVRPSAF